MLMNDRICKCDICGQYFTNDEIVVIHEKGCYETDYGVEPDFTGYHYYTNEKEVCPFCRNSSFKKGSICKICEKFVPYDLSNDDYICDDCYYDNLEKSGDLNEQVQFHK